MKSMESTPIRSFWCLHTSAIVAGLFFFSIAYTTYSNSNLHTTPQEVRVVSWNIQWFPGRSPQASLERQKRHKQDIANALPALSPDILILQEIRDADAAQFLVDHFSELELHVVTNFQRPDTGFSQQLVIASRFPARAGFAEVFSGIYDDPDTEPYRGFAFAALESPWGGTLLVYGVHLKSNRGEAEVNIATREESARQLLSHIAAMKKEFREYGPVQVLLGGDFNVLLEREEMAHEQTISFFTELGYHWAWEGIPFEQRVTWPARGRFSDANFDHFLTYGLPETSAKIIPMPNHNRLSDHRPIALPIPLRD